MYKNHVLSEEITFQTISPEYQSLLYPPPSSASSHGKHYLTILNELPDTFRFRYISDQGSHGGIQPVQVKFHNCDDPSIIHIKASLYTNEDEPRLHTNFLFGNHCEDGVCWVKLSEDCIADFPHLPIFIRKAYEIKSILKHRILEENRQNGEIITENDLEKELKVKLKGWDINSVKFCFEAFCKNESSPVCEKIFSKPIKNIKNKKAVFGKLNISRLSSCSGKATGGDDIILLCEEIDKDNTEIVFFSLDGDENKDWEVNAEFNPNDVHHQVAIYFKTPAYKLNIEKDVFIELRRKSDGKKSNAVMFQYYPCHELAPELIAQQRKKRKIQDTSENKLTASSSSSRTGQCLGNLDEYCESKPPLSMSLLSEANGNEGQFSNGDNPSDELPDEQQEAFNLMTNLFPDLLDEVVPDGLIDNLASLNINEKASDKMLNKSSSSETEQEQMLKNSVMEFIKRSRNDAFFKFLPTLIAFKDEDENNLVHLFIMEKSENLSLLLKILEYADDDLINQVNKMHMTPLLIAVSKNLWRIVKILLKFGADPNIKDKNGNNCVHLAAMFNFPFCMREALASLLGDPKQYIPDIDGLNYDGLAPLHLSIISESEICTELLFQANASVNITDGKSGKTPLHFAYERSSELVTLLLTQPEINPDAKDYRGNIPSSCRLRTPNSSSPITPEPNKTAPKVSSNSNCSEENKILECKDEKPRNNSRELQYDKNYHIYEKEDVFCKKLDSNGLWKQLALYVMEEKEVSTIAVVDPNPTRTVLNQLKKHYGAEYEGKLKFILEDNELKPYAELLHL